MKTNAPLFMENSWLQITPRNFILQFSWAMRYDRMRVVACKQALLLPKSCKYCRQMTGKMNIFMAVVYKRLPRVPIYNTDW